MKGKRLVAAIFGAIALVASVNAAVISVNFIEGGHANQIMDPATTAGVYPRANWNTLSNATGNVTALVNSSGASTTAAINWSASGMWGDFYAAEGDCNKGIGDAQVARAYLNDGEAQTVEISGIPYTTFTAVLHLSTNSRQSGTYLPFTVNGTDYSTVGPLRGYRNPDTWNIDNTIIVSNLTGNALSVVGRPQSNGNRSTICGIQIVDSTEGAPPAFPPVPAPTIESFASDSTVYLPGETATISWITTGAVSLNITPDIGDVTGMTSTQVVYNANITYTLAAINSGGSTNGTLSLLAPTTAPIIHSFSSSSAAVPPGTIITLSWDVDGATSLSIDQGVGDVSGQTSAQVTVNGDTTYTLSALNAFGTSTETVSVSTEVPSPLSIGWNFSERWGNKEVQGEIVDGTDQWTDSTDHAGTQGITTANSTDPFAVTTPINAAMVTVEWSSANTYQAGAETGDPEQKIYRIYLDDGGAGPTITVSGLTEWLTSIDATGYKVDFYRNSDNANNLFAQLDVYEGASTGGTILETLAAQLAAGDGNYPSPNDGTAGARLKQSTAGTFTADVVTFHSQRYLGGGERGSISGFRIRPITEGGPGAPVEDLVITGPIAAGTKMVLSWTGESFKSYGVETNSHLIIGDWQMFRSGIPGNGGTITISNDIGPNQTFYRVISE